MSRNNYFVNNPDNKIVSGTATSILESSDSLSFHKKQSNYSPTPIITLKDLASKLGVNEIHIKDESKRLGLNAFKGVGALYAIDEIINRNNKIDTLCTATDGNHGKAVAWSAKRFGKKAVVVVPGDISSARINAIKEEGAEVKKVPGNYDEACLIASELSEQSGWELIQDTASEGYEVIPATIMAGYLTIFKELEDTINGLPYPSIDIVFLQAGVGSFAASATWYYLSRYGVKRPKLVLCEPREADAVINSFEVGKRAVSNGNNRTIMAGLNCNTPSTSAWEILRSGIDVSLRLDDHLAMEAIRAMYYPTGNDERVFSGESGAAGLAGLLAILNDNNYQALKKILNIHNKTRIMVINTEGPTDPGSFNRIISKEKKL